jgi:hypothetical protein
MISRVLAFLFLSLALPAFAQTASSASVERLLAITRTAAMIDAAYASAQQMITQSLRQSAGPDISAEQQARMDELTQRSMATMREELSWPRLRPDFVRMYQETFTEQEVRAAIAFYESPEGQSMLSKMPGLMQRSMGLMQAKVQALMPRLQSEADEVLGRAPPPQQRPQPAPQRPQSRY